MREGAPKEQRLLSLSPWEREREKGREEKKKKSKETIKKVLEEMVRVSHVFLWKWAPTAPREAVLSELKKLFDEELLDFFTVGPAGNTSFVDLWGTEEGARNACQGFDAGLALIAKDEASFRSWWSSPQHADFMKEYPDFADTKLNMEWLVA